MKTNPLNTDKKRKIINDYNSSFQYYDKRYGEIQLKKYRRFFENRKIQNKKILDAGCGTGLLLEYIFQKDKLKAFPRYKYTGVDIALNMLNKFHLKLEALGAKRIVNLVVADIENLPFRNNVFDEIFSITVFQNLNDIGRGLDSLVRVGKSRFDLVISILKKASGLEIFDTLVKQKLVEYYFDYNHRIEDNIVWGTFSKKED
ncbi:MAG: class I SAM-dependent methyltransferase [Promethearchaeota archaeon]|nr:MAG: class I SAM-dependent methyltransferase [Candidatus Lokiarchaeota archaeon]